MLANMASAHSVGSKTSKHAHPAVTSVTATLRRSRDALHPNWRATMKIGRNAGTGRFTTVKKAQVNKKTHVVETIKRPKR